MNEHVRKIFSTPLVKNTLKLSTSSVLLMFLPLVVTPILSRLYTPADYGAWGIFSSVLYIINAVIFLSYENTIVKCSEDKELPNLLILCMIVATAITILVSVIFSIGKAAKINFFVTFPSVLLLALTIWITSFFTLGTCTANRAEKYGVMSIANIVSGFSQSIIRIFLGLFPIVSYGLIVGNVLARLIAAVYIVVVLFPYIKNIFTYKISLNFIKSLAVKYKKFPIFDAPAKFLEFTVGNIVIIILSFFFGKDYIGCFSMVVQFILLPITVIGSAMGNVYYRELSENISNQASVASITIKVAKMTFILSVLPLLFIALGGDKLLVLFLGPQWIYAGKIALCLVIYSVPVILSEPLLPAFKALDHQEERLKYDLINLFFSIGTLLIVSLINKNLYVVLFIYSVCYATIRFLIFRKLLMVTNVSYKLISKLMPLVIIICYVILFLRICFEKLLM